VRTVSRVDNNDPWRSFCERHPELPAALLAKVRRREPLGHLIPCVALYEVLASYHQGHLRFTEKQLHDSSEVEQLEKVVEFNDAIDREMALLNGSAH
jgi:hypothetical protein